MIRISDQHHVALIGLTGGVGSGKSLVSDLFAQLDVPIIDTDVISHHITKINGIALDALKKALGSAIFFPDGNLNRHYLRELAFNDPQTRKLLENTLHPIIEKVALAQLTDIIASYPDTIYVIIVIPLLAETAFLKDSLDRVLLINADQETQIARVMARNDLSREEVLNIIHAQASSEARRSIADDVIDNNADIKTLASQVKKLDTFYQHHFRQIAQKLQSEISEKSFSLD